MRVVPATVLKRLYMRSNKAGAVQTLAHFFLLVAGAISRDDVAAYDIGAHSVSL